MAFYEDQNKPVLPRQQPHDSVSNFDQNLAAACDSFLLSNHFRVSLYVDTFIGIFILLMHLDSNLMFF
jgi:hypothetical protein